MTLSEHEQHAFAQIERQLRAGGLDYELVAADAAARRWSVRRGLKAAALVVLGLALLVLGSILPVQGGVVLMVLGVVMVFLAALYAVTHRPIGAAARWLADRCRRRRS
ncbi:MAG: DUF3040 domain-containing protein [Mycobacterium sp.]